MKKKFSIILLLGLGLFLSADYGWAQAIYCPESGKGLTIKGPSTKTDIYEETVATCAYYQGQKLKGIIASHFYRDYYKYDECGSRKYIEADLKSRYYRAFVNFFDKDLKDDYPDEYWRYLAYRLLEDTEELALECGNQKRKIKRPFDPTKTSKE